MKFSLFFSRKNVVDTIPDDSKWTKTAAATVADKIQPPGEK